MAAGKKYRYMGDAQEYSHRLKAGALLEEVDRSELSPSFQYQRAFKVLEGKNMVGDIIGLVEGNCDAGAIVPIDDD